jgi:hypothetical protein
VILSERVIRPESIFKTESQSSGQDRTNMHDWVIVLVREEGMYKVKTLCARTVKTSMQGRTYRSIDFVLVRIGPISKFESLRSCKSMVYMQGCVTVL